MLGYINNERKRFKTFVANRLSTIHESSQPSQWFHVPTDHNPADLASRGIDPTDEKKLRIWLDGPNFLRRKELNWPSQKRSNMTISESDMEIKHDAAVNVVTANNSEFMSKLTSKYSQWHKLQRAVAWLIRYKKFCCQKYLKRDVVVLQEYLSVKEI